MNKGEGVGIIGIGSAVPDRVLTNADLEKMVETSDEWIVSRTGIRERRIAGPDVATSDLAAQAGANALQDAGLEPEAIDLVIVATITPDKSFPATACIVQDRLECRRAAAFDLSAACSGFIYAMDVAERFVRTGAYRHVLVIGAETLSRITDWSDRSTCVLFGDGAGAVVIGKVHGRGIISTYLGADGSGGDKLEVPAGGSRCPITPEVLDARAQYIKMSGNEVFRFAVRIMGEAAEEVLRRGGLAPDEVDILIPHQANIRIIDAAAKRLSLPPDRVFVNVHRYGNTSAASIPLALDEAKRSGRIHSGDRVVLVGFGGGLTWAAAALEWRRED